MGALVVPQTFRIREPLSLRAILPSLGGDDRLEMGQMQKDQCGVAFPVQHRCHLIWPLAGEHEIVSPSSRMLLGEASPPYLAHIFLLERSSDWESMHACVHVE